MTVRVAASIATGATIGLLVTYATEMGLALSIALPPLCFLQERRRDAFLVAFSYYSAASSILIPVAKDFFGPGTSL